VAEETTTEEAPRKGGFLMIAIVALASLLVGAAGGVFAVGPMMVGGGGDHEETAEAADDGHGGGGGGSDTLWEIDNLVVNPRDTQGTRFLVVGLAIRMTPGTTLPSLEATEPEVRDAILGLLSAMTVEELSDPSSRETLKGRIRDAIEGAIGKGKISTVLIPQFVLQ
jgi:flagellar FliL protein